MPNRGALEFDLLDRLHKSLRVSGKSRDQLAADLGVHPNTIGNYLRGDTKVTRVTRMAWAIATGVTLRWLETGEPDDDGPIDPNDGPKGESRQQALARLAEKKRRHAAGGATHRYDRAA